MCRRATYCLQKPPQKAARILRIHGAMSIPKPESSGPPVTWLRCLEGEIGAGFCGVFSYPRLLRQMRLSPITENLSLRFREAGQPDRNAVGLPVLPGFSQGATVTTDRTQATFPWMPMPRPWRAAAPEKRGYRELGQGCRALLIVSVDSYKGLRQPRRLCRMVFWVGPCFLLIGGRIRVQSPLVPFRAIADGNDFTGGSDCPGSQPRR